MGGRVAVRGKVAAVTGAGSGIGRALVVELARRDARVSGCDTDAEGLAATAALVPGMHTAVVDVSQRAAMFAYAEAVRSHFGVVHQVYNNAGIAFSQPVAESSWEDYERVFRVNLNGVIHGTQAFLPHLVASGDGHVVNLSSLNGVLAQAGMSHYCTAKFAVRGFTETLALELRRDGLPVAASVVHPGGVGTAIADNAMRLAQAAGHQVGPTHDRNRHLYNEKVLRMDPAKAARIIVDGVEAGRPRILVGGDAILADALVRLAPARVGDVTLWLERRLARSVEPTGRAAPVADVTAGSTQGPIPSQQGDRR